MLSSTKKKQAVRNNSYIPISYSILTENNTHVSEHP